MQLRLRSPVWSLRHTLCTQWSFRPRSRSSCTCLLLRSCVFVCAWEKERGKDAETVLTATLDESLIDCLSTFLRGDVVTPWRRLHDGRWLKRLRLLEWIISSSHRTFPFPSRGQLNKIYFFRSYRQSVAVAPPPAAAAPPHPATSSAAPPPSKFSTSDFSFKLRAFVDGLQTFTSYCVFNGLKFFFSEAHFNDNSVLQNG